MAAAPELAEMIGPQWKRPSGRVSFKLILISATCIPCLLWQVVHNPRTRSLQPILYASPKPALTSLWLADANRIVTEEYVLIPGDLRESELIVRELQQTGFRPDVPTLILAECVLVYMPPEDSQALVSKLGSLCSTAAFVIYEQVNICLALGAWHFHAETLTCRHQSTASDLQ